MSDQSRTTSTAAGGTGEPASNAVLLLTCPDQRGVVAAVADFIARHNGNIVHAEQHTDDINGVFFQRVEFELRSFDLTPDHVLPAFQSLIDRFGFTASLHLSTDRPRTVVLASKQKHCLYDLLTRWRSGELPMDLAAVISNHRDHADICAHMEVPYVHLPVTDSNRDEQRAAVLHELHAHRADLVILARYMQILPNDIVSQFPNRIINIHHSFLPAFIGANPYRQAHDRGVKLIGATAHYVTDDLDEGPIIEQEVARASHRDNVTSLTRKGRDLETIALSRAVRAHLEHRVLVYGNKTVVFS